MLSCRTLARQPFRTIRSSTSSLRSIGSTAFVLSSRAGPPWGRRHRRDRLSKEKKPQLSAAPAESEHQDKAPPQAPSEGATEFSKQGEQAQKQAEQQAQAQAEKLTQSETKNHTKPQPGDQASSHDGISKKEEPENQVVEKQAGKQNELFEGLTPRVVLRRDAEDVEVKLPDTFRDRNIFTPYEVLPRLLENILLEPDSARHNDFKVRLEAAIATVASHAGRGMIRPESAYYVGSPSSAEAITRWGRLYHFLTYFQSLVFAFSAQGSRKERVDLWRRTRSHLGSVSSLDATARWLAQVLVSGLADINKTYLIAYIDGMEPPRPIPPPGTDPQLFTHVQDSIISQIALPPPISKPFERPATFLRLSLHGKIAKKITEAGHVSLELMQYIASAAGAVLLHLEPQDLAVVAGGHVGQNEAWLPGPLSRLGYVSAKLGGRAVFRPGEEADSERRSEPSWASWVAKKGETNTPELSRWDQLKLKVAMESILKAADGFTQQKSRLLIVHLDDAVETKLDPIGNQTLERLLSAIDDRWADGQKICFVGTSIHSHEPWRITDEWGKLEKRHTVLNVPVDSQLWEKSHRASLSHMQSIAHWHQNVRNLKDILLVMGGTDYDVSIEFSPPKWARYLEDSHPLTEGHLPRAAAHQLASIMLYKSRLSPEGRKVIDEDTLLKAIESFEAADYHRRQYKKTEKGLYPVLSLLSKPVEGTLAAHKQAVATADEHEQMLMSNIIDPRDIDMTFDDIHVPGGVTDAIRTLTSLPLERPDAFSYGILASSKVTGCLLYGPPGTGKTLLVRALAKEAKAKVLGVSGATLLDKWLGESEKIVRAVFSLARKLAPCVIFLDEADGFLSSRQSGQQFSARRDMLNQFLKEWDGVTGSGAFVVLATNRPFDLDDAVLRRAPRRVLVDLPLKEGREAILKILLKGEKLGEDVSLAELAKKTHHYSGSDLKNVCVTAATTAVKEEIAEAAKHEGSVPYEYPERRVLHRRHFELAMKEVSASVSEDMETLVAMRKFDQKYGSGRKNQNRSRGMGFQVEPPKEDSERALVRNEKAMTP